MDSNDYIEFEGVRRYQPDALHKRMLAKIAELEAQMSLKWPGVWQQVEDGLINVGAGRHLHIDDDGLWIGVEDLDGDIIGAFLPEGYAICRKLPPAE